MGGSYALLARMPLIRNVYRGLKPVYWCIFDQTALAEAEVEYEDHTSPSVYVKFQVQNADILKFLPSGKPVYLLIWTTTPWTLVSNTAVATHPEVTYVVATDGTADALEAAGLPVAKRVVKLASGEPGETAVDLIQAGEIQRVGGTETIKVDVRILAATNKDLEEMVKAKTFREDLYYRLNVVRIRMPRCGSARRTFPRSSTSASRTS